MKKNIVIATLCLLITGNYTLAKPHHYAPKDIHKAPPMHRPAPPMHHPAPPPAYHPAPPMHHHIWWARHPGCNHLFPFWCNCIGGRFNLNISI